MSPPRFLARALLVVALVLPVPARAWGGFAHRQIAAIAWANVAPRTRVALQALLRQSNALDTPDCRVRTLADASVWPDCVRKDQDRFQYSFAWHFQNEDVCLLYDPRAACAGGNCITAQIERERAAIGRSDLPVAERVRALAFLVHFVGDLHMPLHAASDHDRGGNDLLIGSGAYAGYSLHQLWDGPIAEAALANGPSLVRGYGAADRAELAGGTVADWGRESWGIARTLIYPRVLGRDPCKGRPPAVIELDPRLIGEAAPVARLRILQAGLRLARVLDTALNR